jgi:hypothetical protein
MSLKKTLIAVFVVIGVCAFLAFCFLVFVGWAVTTDAKLRSAQLFFTSVVEIALLDTGVPRVQGVDFRDELWQSLVPQIYQQIDTVGWGRMDCGLQIDFSSLDPQLGTPVVFANSGSFFFTIDPIVIFQGPVPDLDRYLTPVTGLAALSPEAVTATMDDLSDPTFTAYHLRSAHESFIGTQGTRVYPWRGEDCGAYSYVAFGRGN